jgi:hypothetical protein
MGKVKPGPGALEALRQIHAERYSLDRRELAMITAARALGATWHEVSEALGRYGPLDACEHYEELAGRFTPPDLPSI